MLLSVHRKTEPQRFFVVVRKGGGHERLGGDSLGARFNWRIAGGGGGVSRSSFPISFGLGQRSLLYTAQVASLVACFLLAWWVARGVGSRFVLHGALIGIVATLVYLALTRAQPEPFAYVVAHVLKILGGAAGGFVAGRGRGVTSAA